MTRLAPGRTSIVLAAALLIAAGAAAGDSTRWINIHVSEPGSGTNVELHLPLALVTTVLGGIRVDRFDAGMVDLELDDADIDWPKILEAIKGSPDGKLVTVTSDEADVEVKKEQGTVSVHVEEREDEHAVVDVRLPADLLDALTLDDDNRLDLKRVLARLAELPAGDLVRVMSDEAEVRVWVE